jgi:LAO/AO transport system kinase
MSMKINPNIRSKSKKIYDVQYYIDGLSEGNRFILSQCITLIESKSRIKRQLGLTILDKVYQKNNTTIRIGISGSPGVGKSTFIDYLAQYLIMRHHKVAILAIDPSSKKSKGSILGDKTRMENIGAHESIFIRPTSANFELGGISESTKEAIHLCEGAGYNIVIIETVGVGQSEIAVAGIIDLFCLLVLPGAGDDLQGIKRGITEMADIVVVNKSDGDRILPAGISKKQYAHSLHLLRPKLNEWNPMVFTASSIEKTGVEEIWKGVESFITLGQKSGYFQNNRKEQELSWFTNKFKNMATEYFLKKEIGIEKMRAFKIAIENNEKNPFEAINQLFEEVFI